MKVIWLFPARIHHGYTIGELGIVVKDIGCCLNFSKSQKLNSSIKDNIMVHPYLVQSRVYVQGYSIQDTSKSYDLRDDFMMFSFAVNQLTKLLLFTNIEVLFSGQIDHL